MSDDNFNNPWGNKSGKSSNESLRELISKLEQFLTGKKNSFNNQGNSANDNKGSKNTIKLICIILLVIFCIWMATGFYTVQTDEEGVILRFGKYNRTSKPGLNYKLPNPIEQVVLISVTRVNKEEIGFRTISSSKKGDSTKSIPQESQMLTGDENIVDIDFDVQWLIKDPKAFLFNVRDIGNENTVKSSAESAMREVIGLVKISDALAEERNKIEQDAKELLQEILDNYNMGIKVERLQMLRVQPPPEVLDAYRDVQSSKADRERLINQAYAYNNEIIPKARGEAQQLIQEAEGYKSRVVANAEGEARRFTEVYNQYAQSKDVTKSRMYLETMESVLDGMNKVIVSKNLGNGVMPLLGLDKLMEKKSSDKSSKSNSSELESKAETEETIKKSNK